MSKKSTFTLRSGNKPSSFKVMGASPAKSWADSLQTGLTVAGMVPGLGNIADAVNTGISGARAGYAKFTGDEAGVKKNMANMAINAASMIPGAGLAVGGAKLGAKAVKGGKEVAKQVAKKAAKKATTTGAKKAVAAKVDSDTKKAKDKKTVAMKGKSDTGQNMV
jgi:hypothetical protein